MNIVNLMSHTQEFQTSVCEYKLPLSQYNAYKFLKVQNFIAYYDQLCRTLFIY